MRVYGWSWAEYEATPPYVRRVLWDMHVARREAQQAAEERANGG
jgi:hypothetical protein